MGVSIIGVGLHPFGRFPISGREMGLIAAREAMADAGIAWDQVDFAAGGSRDGGHADALVKELGLAGTPFMSVYNGCATGGSALLAASHAIESGAAVGAEFHALRAERDAGLVEVADSGRAAVLGHLERMEGQQPWPRRHIGHFAM